MGPVVVRYSEAFKLRVVRELESGRFRSREEAKERYGIKSAGTVGSWVRKYGNCDIQGRFIRVETTDERDQIKALKARIADLERAVIDSKIQEALYKEYFDIACRETGVENPEALKKSIAEKLSRERSSTTQTGK